jgi:hypothetical protein
MNTILQRLIKDNFSELAGLTVDASIPLSEHLVNELIQSELQGNKNITECYVAIHSGNKITVNLQTVLWPWPVNLKLRVEPFVDVKNNQRIKASLENFVLLGKLGALFKAFPQGITTEDDQIILDLGHLLKTPEQRKWLTLIKSVEIRTEEAKMTIDIKITIE